MLKDSSESFQCLIEFIDSLIVRKLIFEVNLGFNWKKLKSES
jgi:hypothetical protein